MRIQTIEINGRYFDVLERETPETYRARGWTSVAETMERGIEKGHFSAEMRVQAVSLSGHGKTYRAVEYHDGTVQLCWEVA